MFGEYRTAGELHWASRNHICAGRVISFGKAASLAILLLIGSSIIDRAATLEGVARCRAIQSSSKRWQCFNSLKTPKQSASEAKRGDTPKAQRENAPKTDDIPRTEDVPADALRGKQEAAPDDPASTSSINHLRTVPGQPVCVDQDSLAAALVAGVLASDPAQATTTGCQTLPDDAEVDVIQQFPSGFQFLRIVKVKVTSHVQPEPSVGYTIEIGR
jgi:hypothetical protein